MAYSSLNNIFVRNTIPSVITLEKIGDGLQITLSQFFDINMLVTESIDVLTSDERTIISMYRELDRNSKELLRAYLMGLSRKLPENSD